MEKNKKITIFLIVLFLAITIINIIIYLNIYNINIILNEKQNAINYSSDLETKYYNDMAFYEIENNGIYYKIKNCVNSYYNAINGLWTDNSYSIDNKGNKIVTEENKEYQANRLLGIIGSEYTKQNNLSINNINKIFPNNEKGTIVCKQILEYDLDEDISIFIVNGTNIINKNNRVDFTLLVIIDNNKNCFSIYPEEYLTKNKIKRLEIGDSLPDSVKEITDIEKNEYNELSNIVYMDEDIIKDYYNLYKFYLSKDRETAYKLLDDEYRKKKFKNIEDFELFVDNKLNVNIAILKKYKVINNEQYKQYVLIDSNNNYYIFTEFAPMKYSVVFDTYTIDLPQFIEKYNSSTNEEKVLLNLQKCFEAINNKDYAYMYNKLDETFKTNNFKTQADFEKYIKANFFEENKVGAKNPKLHGDIYTYELTISDASGKKTNKVNKTFVMQLNEGTDFVMSFSK